MHRILRLPAALITDVKRLIRWLGRAAVLAEAAEIDLAAFLACPAALRRTGLALLIIITVTTKVTKGEIVK